MARIAGVDLPKEKRVEIGLTYIYGIGLKRSQKILSDAKVSGDVRVKDLTADQEQAIRKEVAKYVDKFLYKFVYYSIKYKRPTWFMLVSTGGFPSSHTSLVVTLTLLLGMLQFHDLGYLDWSFSVALAFGILTLHDAMGVRWETGIQAKVINNMMDWFLQLDKDIPVEEKLSLATFALSPAFSESSSSTLPLRPS